MKRRSMITLALVVMILQLGVITNASSYSNVLQPNEYGNTLITWSVLDAPEIAFEWQTLDFIFIENWIAEDNSKMTFEVTSIGDSDSYLTGIITLGNLSMTTNSSDIGFNLVLGVFGLTRWFPGIAIPTGSSAIEAQNQTAYAAAARVPGNYLNGTMDSRYENITVGGNEYECIVWDFIQDARDFGEPQITTLAYDLETGVLVRSNSSYTFDTPYILVLELDSIQVSQPLDFVLIGMISGLLIVALVVVFFLKKR